MSVKLGLQMTIRRETEVERYHRKRKRNLLDVYLSVKDWATIDGAPGERFILMTTAGVPREFDRRDINAFYSLAYRSNRYRIFTSQIRDVDKKWQVSISYDPEWFRTRKRRKSPKKKESKMSTGDL